MSLARDAWRTARSVVARFLARGPKYAPRTSGGTSMLAGVRAGNVADIEAMRATGTLFAVIDVLAENTAQVDWRLFRVQKDRRRVYGPGDDNRTEIVRHQALVVWDNPNPLMDRMGLVERTQQCMDLAGEAFWLVEKTSMGSIPIGLWPIRPDRMVEVISDDGLVGWTYRSPDGVLVPFTLDEIIHLNKPDPMNVYRGISPVQALATDLESVVAAGQYNRNFFRSSAAPSGVIQVEGSLTDTEFDRVAAQWGERHKGVRNAHKVGVLENGMTWVDTTIKMRDMQFAELRNLSRELIREAYRVHEHMLGLSGDVNRANAVAADATFAKRQLAPRLERIKGALNSRFLPMFGATGTGIEFCFDNPVPPDAETENAERTSKVTAAVALVGAGFKAEGVLKAMGLPPMEFEEPEPAPVVAPRSPAPAPASGPDEELDERDLKTVKDLLRDVFV